MTLQRMYPALVLLACALLLACGCTQRAAPVPAQSAAVAAPGTNGTPAPTNVTAPAALEHVLLETTMGNITIALDPDMPITAGNFEKLARSGFYDGVIFHRVIPGFMIQGGDPTGTGFGGPGYTIPDEFTAHNHNARGTVAMANTGEPNTGGSQFFINLVDNGRLDANYPVFGTVTAGMDVVDAIANVARDANNRPLTNVTILHAEMV
jgi:peptidylprolyl isomerase